MMAIDYEEVTRQRYARRRWQDTPWVTPLCMSPKPISSPQNRAAGGRRSSYLATIARPSGVFVFDAQRGIRHCEQIVEGRLCKFIVTCQRIHGSK